MKLIGLAILNIIAWTVVIGFGVLLMVFIPWYLSYAAGR